MRYGNRNFGIIISSWYETIEKSFNKKNHGEGERVSEQILVHMVSEFLWRQLEIEHRNHGLKFPDRGVPHPLIFTWEPVPDTKTRPHRTRLGSLL